MEYGTNAYGQTEYGGRSSYTIPILTFAVAAIGVVSMTFAKTYTKTLAVVAVGVASLSRMVEKILAVSSTGVVSISRVIYKNLLAVGYGITSYSYFVVMQLSVTVKGIASMIKLMNGQILLDHWKKIAKVVASWTKTPRT
jgi:hypothetical protein